MTEWLGDPSAATLGGEADARAGIHTVVAGFEPFDGRTQNRSWDLVRGFRARPDTDVYRLPVDFGQLPDVVGGILGRHPRALLLVGEAPVDRIRVEQVALNLADSDRPDNAGRLPRTEPIVAGAPLALSSPWDARGLAGRMHQEEIPAAVSFHAGTFACNAALFLALHRASEAGGRVPVGFLHIPSARGTAGLGVSRLERAIEMGILTLTDLAGDTE